MTRKTTEQITPVFVHDTFSQNDSSQIGFAQNFNRFSLFWVLLASALAFACGPNNQSVQAPDGTTGRSSDSTDANAAISQCNQFQSTTGRLAGKVQIASVENEMKLRLISVASDFDATSNFKIRFFRWKANASSNTAELDSSPLEFRLQNGTTVLAASLREITRDQLTPFRASLGVTSSEQVLNKVDLYLKAVDYSWQALKTVMYNGTAVAAQTDSLLPAFLAEPNRYAQSHAGVLNQIHPFWNKRSLGWTDSQFAAQSNIWCF